MRTPILSLMGFAVLAVTAIGADAVAQAPAKPAASEIITLGTGGGPQPRAGSAQSANMLIVNGKLYLIDAGDGVTRRIVQAGLKVPDVGVIFITHNHSDHMGGLANLMNTEWESARKTPINVYGPPGTERVVAAARELYRPNAEIRWSEGRRVPLEQVFVGHDVGTGTIIFQDENVRVTAAENTHFKFTRDEPGFGRHKSYSYRFETPDRSIVFTGDTGPSDALVALATGADVLVTEVNSLEEVKESRIKAGLWQQMPPVEQEGFIRHMQEEHLTPEAVGTLATRAGVRTVVLTHFGMSGIAKDDHRRFVGQVAKTYPGRVLVAQDGAKF